MDRTYQKFLRSGIDLTPVGMERRKDNAPYFCTPRGASVFGWVGTDGIHFCFIRGFGGMVFSVNPMNAAPEYVHPLAKDFADFLRLLLACGSTAALEQAWMWDEVQFEAFLRENPPTQEGRRVLAEISERMKLSPMERPWEYIRKLQSSFDFSRIKYTEDYYDIEMNPAAGRVSPPWEVYFDGNFWGHHGKDRAGKEIRIGRQFNWAGYHWVIPAVYSCSKGLVMDLCMRVDAERIQDFMDKWNLNWENDSCENFSREEQMQMEMDNPLALSFTPHVKWNGRKLRASHGCSASFNPCLPDEITYEMEAKTAMEHYGLDASHGWVIYRNAFPWETKRRPALRSLSLTMEEQPVQVPGAHIKVHGSGDSFAFSHPVSGTTYRLTVREIEKQTLPPQSVDSDRWLYPKHYAVMSYTLSPEPLEPLRLADCDEGDRPMEITLKADSFQPDAIHGCCIGIIGGAQDPTAIAAGDSSPEKLHTVCSSLHFEPVQGDLEWRIVFEVRRYEAGTFSLV